MEQRMEGGDMKFKEQFAEPICFSDGSWAVDGTLDKEAAREMINESMFEQGCIDEPLVIEALEKDRVRFGFAPETVEELAGELCWYSGATGKGSMPIWVVK